MEDINAISIITVNVSGLNTPIKERLLSKSGCAHKKIETKNNTIEKIND